jgi:hypothetical protein
MKPYLKLGGVDTSSIPVKVIENTIGNVVGYITMTKNLHVALRHLLLPTQPRKL